MYRKAAKQLRNRQTNNLKNSFLRGYGLVLRCKNFCNMKFPVNVRFQLTFAWVRQNFQQSQYQSPAFHLAREVL